MFHPQQGQPPINPAWLEWAAQYQAICQNHLDQLPTNGVRLSEIGTFPQNLIKIRMPNRAYADYLIQLLDGNHLEWRQTWSEPDGSCWVTGVDPTAFVNTLQRLVAAEQAQQESRAAVLQQHQQQMQRPLTRALSRTPPQAAAASFRPFVRGGLSDGAQAAASVAPPPAPPINFDPVWVAARQSASRSPRSDSYDRTMAGQDYAAYLHQRYSRIGVAMIAAGNNNTVQMRIAEESIATIWQDLNWFVVECGLSKEQHLQNVTPPGQVANGGCHVLSLSGEFFNRFKQRIAQWALAQPKPDNNARYSPRMRR